MKQVLCAGIVGLLSVACGAPDTTSGESDRLPNDQLSGEHADPAGGSEQPALSADVEVLHQFSAYGSDYTITYAEPDVFLLSGTGSPTTLALPETWASGPLTLLENYLALAPDGDPPDPRLVEYHAQEAQLLGRADNSVLQVELDLKTAVDKGLSNLSLCKVFALDKLHDNTGGWSETLNSTSFSGNISWGSGTSTELPLVTAACNYGGTTAYSSWAYYKPSSALDWSYWGTVTSQPNSGAYLRWGLTAFAKQVKLTTYNNTGVGQVVSAYYVY